MPRADRPFAVTRATLILALACWQIDNSLAINSGGGDVVLPQVGEGDVGAREDVVMSKECADRFRLRDAWLSVSTPKDG